MAAAGRGGWRAPGAVLLVSTYELGHQPSGITIPKAFLERAGFAPAALDLAVESLDEARVTAAQLVVFSVPMHTALRLALGALGRIRTLNPAARLAFHGLYALLHAPLLREAGACAVLGGECEEELVALVERLERATPTPDPFAPSVAPQARSRRAATSTSTSTSTLAARAGPGQLPLSVPDRAILRRLDFPVPSRTGLPPPARYARLVEPDGRERLAGHAEASRGCKHLCRHCPITPLYGGRFFAIPVEVVVEDVARQVAAGITHVTFGDPDFLNGPRHAARVADAIHRRFPRLTFDFTAKVEHLVRHAALLPALREAGALFVVSAVESLSDRVLDELAKGHHRADVFRAFAACRAAGLALRPSLLPFTPWSTLDDYLDLLATFEREGWAEALDPVQLSIRLLLPPRSLLLADPELAVEGLDADALSHRWRHPDPRMDALQLRVAELVEAEAARGEDALATFRRVERLARAAAGLPHRHVAFAADTGKRAPRLSESWFC